MPGALIKVKVHTYAYIEESMLFNLKKNILKNYNKQNTQQESASHSSESVCLKAQNCISLQFRLTRRQSECEWRCERPLTKVQ